jgi:hypothetical protein
MVGCRATAPVVMPPSQLVFAPHLQSNLGILAEGLEREIPLCLTGPIRGDTAEVTGIHIPKIVRSDTVSTDYEGDTCPANTLAFWHNHPKPETVDFEEKPNPGCWLSWTDLRTSIREGRLFEVVQTSRGNWCWFSRYQIVAVIFTGEGEIPDYLPYIPGQGTVPITFGGK